MAIPKQVFAHHVSYEDYNFGLVNFTRDMNDAITYGIDGFVLNTGSWSGTPVYQTIASTYYQAAMGTNFKLFFSLDMTGDLTEADILAMVALYYDHPNQYRINGVPVLSVWGGQASTFALTQSSWQTILAALVAQGTPVFFLPYIYPQSSPTSGGAIETPSQAQIALNLEECWSQIPIDGYFWPAGPPLPAFSASATPEFTTALHDAGVIYMAGVSPQYWGDVQTGQAGRRYTEFDGYEGFIEQWMSIINSGADLVEIFTWNDFNEATYVSPIDDPVKYWPEYNRPLGFYGTHVGFTALAQYFIEWYKTGVQPAIPGGVDNLYWCHRITPQAMVASDDPQGPVTSFTGDIADNVYITTNLVAPAQLVVNAGNGNQTYSVPEGLSSTRIPFVAPVIPTIALVRAGATVISTWTTQIVDSGTYYNFNYFTGTAIASATPVIASISNQGYTNYSGTLTTGGVSQALMPINNTRQVFLIHNPNTTDYVWVSFGTTAAVVNGAGSIGLAPGQTLSSSNLPSSTFAVTTTDAINWTGPTTGDNITAYTK